MRKAGAAHAFFATSLSQLAQCTPRACVSVSRVHRYAANKDLRCVTCSTQEPVNTRWGSETCGQSSTRLYQGFMAAPWYNHEGSGYNFMCMHNTPQFSGGDNGHSGRFLSQLFATEYQAPSGFSGATWREDNEAACAVCLATGSVQTYVQWGRNSCTNGHTTE